MKKLLLVLIAGTMIGNSYAQDGADKKFHFGLITKPMINWYSPDDKNDFDGDGAGLKFGFGLMTDFSISENIWFSTGFGLDFDGGKINYLEEVGYWVDDNDIITLEDQEEPFNDSTSSYIVLTNRKFKANYVNIPLYLKMKTKEIGMMKYFGQFGLNAAIKTKGRANDIGTNLSGLVATSYEAEDLQIDSEMNLFKLSLGIGGGIEYNFSGSTSLIAGLNFNYGFNSAVKKESEHLFDIEQTAIEGSTVAYSGQKFVPFGLSLTVGIIF